MKKLIIFDVDGTLIETAVSNTIGLKITMNELYNKSYTDEDVRQYMGIPGDEALRNLNVKEEEISRVWSYWEGKVRENSHHNYVFEGICEMLEELNKKFSLAIVTSKTHSQLEEDFIKRGLIKYFDIWICKEDTDKHKPNPDPLIKALEKAKVEPKDAIYLGDAFVDCKAATAINMDFAHCRFMDKYDEVDCEIIFNKPKEIIEYFCR
ncbi:haloacid dehalogenase superfamily, subfamily IA, variant 1 with third motif having Dx(3-4)D or Dx(3-4)E [Clostridium cavendishii DSM 21758]|uniref:Haloacid dehalogenase superfamily, subfamily IA, variant 1 with third motif having Dx(3-4)D or Dx(3-4)E n=1 Tax=Clostridium cavendishii DSM 21758 TaxID=1121302 RepID=A0A1M6I9P2_9CLOT|nr:HAD family hydrolase [Clostridium cavendishii]SHJ31214.1 haloacid dehalogenase superfamily, subfamily IA, variant 1 with third motif having Dx(3-4)D or Dx(3-4)E [Clostridium cavendishii DSM 21758]